MLWIKLTIIFGIIAICSYLLVRLLVGAMDLDEKIAMAAGKVPNKIAIPILIAILSAAAAVAFLIVAVATW